MVDLEERPANQNVGCPRALLPQRRRKELEKTRLFRESTLPSVAQT